MGAGQRRPRAQARPAAGAAPAAGGGLVELSPRGGGARAAGLRRAGDRRLSRGGPAAAAGGRAVARARRARGEARPARRRRRGAPERGAGAANVRTRPQAIRLLERAHQLDPAAFEVTLELAARLARAGKRDRALRLLEELAAREEGPRAAPRAGPRAPPRARPAQPPGAGSLSLVLPSSSPRPPRAPRVALMRAFHPRRSRASRCSRRPLSPAHGRSGPLRRSRARAGSRASGAANAEVFLGVPFAAPPVGELRWRPPRRPCPGGACAMRRRCRARARSSRARTAESDELRTAST